jgi:hypothetical protein
MEKNGFANRNMSLFGITVGRIGIAYNVSGDFECTSNLIRICASTKLILKSKKYHVGDGLILPEGAVEYFEVEKGDILNIEGTANVCCM